MAAPVPAPSAARCWRFDRWPALDRVAWELGCTPGDPFDDDPRHGARLRQGTRQKVIKGYGRWLDFLDAHGQLDPGQAPLARVTRERLHAYFLALRAAGNADWTVVGRFEELVMALRVLAPGADVSWVRRPGGTSVRLLLLRKRRARRAPDAGVLFGWGLEMMDGAASRRRTRDRLAAYRDGLLIAMLAARGRRLRSMTLLRVGHELLRVGVCYRIELAPEQVKTNKADHFDLPEELTLYIERYLAEVRPALMDGQAMDEVWVSKRGTAMSADTITQRILRLTRQRFGWAFGPHRFRHAIATTASLRVPGHPRLAAGLLDISLEVLERHYNLAEATQAAGRYDELIERLRQQPRG